MISQVTATVIGGMVKPDEKLELADQTRVNLTIEPLGDRIDPSEALQILRAWIKANPLHGLGRRASRDELHERR